MDKVLILSGSIGLATVFITLAVVAWLRPLHYKKYSKEYQEEVDKNVGQAKLYMVAAAFFVAISLAVYFLPEISKFDMDSLLRKNLPILYWNN